jgi:hypothetical protein
MKQRFQEFFLPNTISTRKEAASAIAAGSIAGGILTLVAGTASVITYFTGSGILPPSCRLSCAANSKKRLELRFGSFRKAGALEQHGADHFTKGSKIPAFDSPHLGIKFPRERILYG